MAVLIGVLLAILVIAVVIYPFVKARFQPRSPLAVAPPDRVDPGGREAIYEEIRTLQLEYEMGSIDESEYEEQLRAYRLQAAATLRDQVRIQQEMDLLMEKEIMAARGATSGERGSPEGKGDDRPV